MKIKTATLPTGLPCDFFRRGRHRSRCWHAPFGHAQGIVRGAQEGSHEGNRVAGPVGGVVGGAVGAGVGGAVGASKACSAFPTGYRGHRCRGYYDRYDHFHCYR